MKPSPVLGGWTDALSTVRRVICCDDGKWKERSGPANQRLP
jgi:hypothetical protein